ncbi:MAG: gliding motility-associated peptidyl-prolyl isomerase GldI [Flavobacteriales bacterium CG03_land_8_20_14_0_80_35_15]|nr:MAG: gliding motility-associated peptidyl-prolyl isomerase GldI [Flavobacteriales bacterium CG03_land_8_20_14_0_80_35_15]
MKPQFKVVLHFLMLWMVLGSCSNPTPRYPVKYRDDTNFNEIINQNKLLVGLQDKAFNNYISSNPEMHFINSQSGFWYAYLNQNHHSNRTPKPSETVIFTYQIADIDNQIIYSKEELGEQSFVIDKEQRETGLQNGLKLMKENEEVMFLFPSFLAYGVLGDRKKIKTNQPLIYTVYLKKIINNKKN